MNGAADVSLVKLSTQSTADRTTSFPRRHCRSSLWGKDHLFVDPVKGLAHAVADSVTREACGRAHSAQRRALVADESGRSPHDPTIEALGVSRGGDRETRRLGLEEPVLGNFDQHEVCLLYTSDAADDLLCVD